MRYKREYLFPDIPNAFEKDHASFEEDLLKIMIDQNKDNWQDHDDLRDRTIIFTIEDTLLIGANKTCEISAPYRLEILGVDLYVKTAPTGTSIIVDVNQNGTTIFTTQSHRPTIAASGHSGTSEDIDVPALPKGNRITVDLDQVGSSVKGKDLTVSVRCRRY